ncbi:hypothetical protein MA16_Dca008834 [Dendrobium catenatum]|uniref:Uncharacterized protein n=1 Tax=Dendrobium catenatum TaxID=906689 RepID=A0A2I0VUG2_9ASPA|nr:hypothetical protein MA16_Dca008834 [Dendrobium catenatum]
MSVTVSLLAETGCTLRVFGDTPSSLPADPHKFVCHIDRLSSAEDPILSLASSLASPPTSKALKTSASSNTFAAQVYILPNLWVSLFFLFFVLFFFNSFAYRVLIPVSHDRGSSRGESHGCFYWRLRSSHRC